MQPYIYTVGEDTNPYYLPDSEFTAPTGMIFDKWAEGSVDGEQYEVAAPMR